MIEARPSFPRRHACSATVGGVIARDTTPEALAAWRRLGAAGRFELAWELSESARGISIEGMLANDRSSRAARVGQALVRETAAAKCSSASRSLASTAWMRRWSTSR